MRLDMLEHNYYDMHLRLVRADETQAQLATKCQSLAEALAASQKVRLSLPRRSNRHLTLPSKTVI